MASTRVLIVEDDEAVARLHYRIVSRTHGFEVVGVAADAQEAVRRIDGLRPDLVLLDLTLRTTRGETVLAHLRQLDYPAEVIVVTASRDTAMARDLLHSGAIDYLIKPFSPERLQEALVLYRHRRRGLSHSAVTQGDLDGFLRPTGAARRYLPVGLRESTLSLVRTILQHSPRPMSAEAVGRQAHIARVTARRYLDYLAASGQAIVRQESSGPGRPRYVYTILTHNRQSNSTP